MAIVDETIEAYLEALAPTTDVVQAEMERIGAERRFPIIGPLVGRLLRQVATSTGARDVFEMGSGFGYSTWWFSRAVGPDGRITHTDGSQALSDEVFGWIERDDEFYRRFLDESSTKA